ncbi:transposase [Plantactinospora sp. S1510]|uniref:Transposase n=2 Tax=Plantactinospora alkalitolerans TaxID=2789879 RepID=A0ABS0H198_9ACTN|nr:transposase [Plantactinospora alkalitolerans]
MWNETRQRGEDVMVVTFPASTCIPCPVRTRCTTSKQRRRQLTLRPRHLHEALRYARAEQTTDDWKPATARAGIEGTINQTLTLTGIRKARYTGLDKVHLEHAFAATAINLTRLSAWWTGKPSTEPARPTSHNSPSPPNQN